MLRRTINVLLVVSLFLVLSAYVSVFAAARIDINSFAFVEGGGCQYVALSLQVVDLSPEDPALNVQILKNGSPVDGTTVSVYPSGAFTQGFVVDAVNGDSITAVATLSGLNATAGPLVCGGGGGTGETGGGSSGGGGGNTTPGDGRLNFSPDEYYTLYCAFDQLEIWRGVPTGLLLQSVPLASLLALSAGQAYAAGGGTTILRDSEDVFTVYGSDGNLASQAGSKAFLMSECLARNGGTPETVQQVAPPVAEPQLTFCADPATFNDRSCFESEEAWCIANNYLPNDCTAYNVFRWLGALLTEVFQCAMLGALGLIGVVFMAPPNQRGFKQQVRAFFARLTKLD